MARQRVGERWNDLRRPPLVREGAMGRMHLAYPRDPSENKFSALHRMR